MKIYLSNNPFIKFAFCLLSFSKSCGMLNAVLWVMFSISPTAKLDSYNPGRSCLGVGDCKNLSLCEGEIEKSIPRITD